MAEPVFKVRERRDFLKEKQMETWKSESSGKMPNHKGVVNISTDEYCKPVSKKKKEDTKEQ